LEWIPGLEDKTNGYTDYSILADIVELLPRPDYIIRNATYFRRLNINVPTISLLQDANKTSEQIDVCCHSDIVVFNSPYTLSLYDAHPFTRTELIPLGVDSDFFKPKFDTYPRVLPNSILFVGASNNFPKGFDIVLDLILNTDYNFCLVMKDDFRISHERVTVFNKVEHDELKRIYNSCSMLLCTSRIETQHLAGIEAGLCNLPIVTSNVGIYYNKPNGEWGINVKDNNFKAGIDFVMRDNRFNPRKYWLEQGIDKKTCKEKWIHLIEEITHV